MYREPSPLLHDYKSTAPVPAKKPRPLGWFIAGLGVPLVATAALMMQPDSPATPDAAAVPIAGAELEAGGSASIDSLEVAVFDDSANATTATEAVLQAAAEPVTTELPAPPEAVVPSFHPPLVMHEPDYDSLRITIRRGDTLDRVFRRNDLSLSHLAQIAKLPDAGEHLRMLRPGDEIEIHHVDGKIVTLLRDLELTRSLKVSLGEDGFESAFVERPVQKTRRLAFGRIKSSLFESAAEAGLNDALIMNFAGIFAWDVDFVLDIRKDDNYYVLYEELWQDGKFVANGEIIAAEFNNNGRAFKAVRYVDKNGRADYFTPEGRSVRKAFIPCTGRFHAHKLEL